MPCPACGDACHNARRCTAMTLSVCCLTSDPGARVAAILRQLRPVADEIVVAVDSRLDPERLGRYADVADRLLRYEFVDSAEQAAPWLTAQCTGDWILRIDGDEVMDPALIERLPDLIRARDVFQYWLPCRWLFPDADHYLAQPPWHFSGSRLVRNDLATIWHQGLSHGGFESVFPSVHLSESFYHLSLLVHDRAYREAKVARYMSIASGHSRSVLETDVAAFYLPEQDQRFGITAAPVPARDRAAIAEVLAAAGEELPGPSPEEIPMWSWSKIQRVWPRRTLAEDAYRGEIEMFERAPRLYGGQRRQVTVRVRNTGAEHWPGLNRGPWIKLSHRWPPGTALPMIAVLWGALLCPLFFIRQLPLAMLFLGVAGASWAPYTPMETTLLQRLVPAEIRGQVFGARHSLVVAATPLGAAFGGLLLQYLPAPLVIAISGLACIVAGLGGLVSPSLRRLQRGNSSR